MIGRFRFVVAALLVIVFPAGLMSQTADLNRSTIVGERIPGGCFVPGTVLGGGSPQRPAGDQVIHGFHLANLDRSVSPCEDFFKFANGGWIKNNPIPADHSSWSTFNQLHDRNVLYWKVASINPERIFDWLLPRTRWAFTKAFHIFAVFSILTGFTMSYIHWDEFRGSVLGLFAPDVRPPPDVREVRPSPGAHVLAL